MYNITFLKGKNMKYNKVSVSKAFKMTAPFLAARALVYGIMTGVLILLAIIAIALISTGEGIIALFGFFILILGYVGTKWVERYVLYVVKAGQIFSLTEYIKTGQAPATSKGIKGVMAFGTEKVKDNFGATNVAFVADTLISSAVRQITRFLNRVGNFLSFIPAAETLIGIISAILAIALNYIDEAVLSYVFMKKDEEEDVWKRACDGIVYFGQSWKDIIKAAVKVTLSIVALRIVVIGISFIAGLIISGGTGALIGLIIGFILMYPINKILIDPYATVIMINDYYMAIEGQEIKTDLYAKFSKASRKFKEIFGKAKGESGAQTTA